MSRPLRNLAILVFSSAAALGLTNTASAAPESLQQQIASTIAQYGGTQISAYEISWHDGDVIMAFPLPGEEKAPPSSAAAQELQRTAAQKEAARQGITISSVAQPTAATVGGCPTETLGNDWYCFYQDDNYGNRRLLWNAEHLSNVYFSDYGFEDETSSWVNGGGKTIWVYDQTAGKPQGTGPRLWTENDHSHSTYVGDANNDRANWFRTS
ncbi:hypothetical protein [Streptomyces xylophagus]|uniref:hypothetical protein n=1 Tax=Streptomyces xylophagus TaxID=285514 RepID=UPI00131B2ADD|nr:hypothetical protein [Streptomyces xylophagus]